MGGSVNAVEIFNPDSTALVTPELMRQKVVALQDALLEMPQTDIVTTHTFLPGVYERKITVPPWTVLTGAAHKTDYRVRLEKGTIAVNRETEVVVLTAPCEFDAKAGEQRAGRVFEDEVVWVDVYENPDDCQDLEVLEDRLYVVPECGLGDTRKRLAIESARADYQLFLEQLGVDQNTMDAVVTVESDLVNMPEGHDVELKESPVHGVGMFATRHFFAGEVICPGRLDGKRTPAGRYINHSHDANVIPHKFGDDIYAIALKDIPVNGELFVDYRASMRVNFGLHLPGEIPCLDGQQPQS
jgi:hypothetical protein